MIQNHLRDVQVRFHDRVIMLETEIKHRDMVIAQLQHRIVELEQNSMSSPPLSGSHPLGDRDDSTGSSGEIPFVVRSEVMFVILHTILFLSLSLYLLFQRGDSLDTIFASSPPPEAERNRTKLKSKKRSSPRRRLIDQRDESTDQEYSLSMSPYQSFDNEFGAGGSGMVIDNITGNITRVPDSVVLNIESSSNESSVEVPDDDDADDDDDDDEQGESDDDGDDELHCDDWEIRMLAAELNRRESKREEQLQIAASMIADVEDPATEGRLVRRRSSRMHSEAHETDTEPSEAEARGDQVARPRAASLDQHNLRREKAKGVFKAFSFDRDKDRL